METQLRTRPRFPELAEGDGHYESFYLKASHPTDARALWIRYTVHKRPGQGPLGSLWFALFDTSAEGPQAVKQTFPRPASSGDDYIRIGDARFGDGRVEGSAEGEGRSASWDLTFEPGGEAFHHLPRGFLYKAPIPRTKLLSPYPDARFSGRAEIDGRVVDLDGWRGMVGHNWGAEHAERWIWMHGTNFDGHDDAWLDAGIGRIKVGPLTTPWIANGVLHLDGVRHRLGGPEKARKTDVHEAPDRCDFTLPGSGITVQGTVGAARKDFVGWIYADPDGSEHNTVNCSAAEMTLTVSRPGLPPLTLKTPGGAAYELGMRETDHGIPIQPFGDG